MLLNSPAHMSSHKHVPIQPCPHTCPLLDMLVYNPSHMLSRMLVHTILLTNTLLDMVLNMASLLDMLLYSSAHMSLINMLVYSTASISSHRNATSIQPCSDVPLLAALLTCPLIDIPGPAYSPVIDMLVYSPTHMSSLSSCV